MKIQENQSKTEGNHKSLNDFYDNLGKSNNIGSKPWIRPICVCHPCADCNAHLLLQSSADVAGTNERMCHVNHHHEDQDVSRHERGGADVRHHHQHQGHFALNLRFIVVAVWPLIRGWHERTNGWACGLLALFIGPEASRWVASLPAASWFR